MNEDEISLLYDYGWTVVCESPLEIEKEDTSEDKATGEAAEIILSWCKHMER